MVWDPEPHPPASDCGLTLRDPLHGDITGSLYHLSFGRDSNHSLVWGELGPHSGFRASLERAPSLSTIQTKMPPLALGVPDACHTRVPVLEALEPEQR